MTVPYLTDEEILTAACVIPADMITSSGRVPPEYAQMIMKLHEDCIDLCMVVWLDDTIAFMSYNTDCSRRLNIDPPCRLNIDPRPVAVF